VKILKSVPHCDDHQTHEAFVQPGRNILDRRRGPRGSRRHPCPSSGEPGGAIRPHAPGASSLGPLTTGRMAEERLGPFPSWDDETPLNSHHGTARCAHRTPPTHTAPPRAAGWQGAGERWKPTSNELRGDQPPLAVGSSLTAWPHWRRPGRNCRGRRSKPRGRHQRCPAGPPPDGRRCRPWSSAMPVPNPGRQSDAAQRAAAHTRRQQGGAGCRAHPAGGECLTCGSSILCPPGLTVPGLFRKSYGRRLGTCGNRQASKSTVQGVELQGAGGRER